MNYVISVVSLEIRQLNRLHKQEKAKNQAMTFLFANEAFKQHLTVVPRLFT